MKPYEAKHLAGYFTDRAEAPDLVANGYDLPGSDRDPEQIYDDHFSVINRCLVLEPTDDFLEIGSGTGELLLRASRLVHLAKGVDVSEGMVSRACAKGLDVELVDGKELPFADNSFSKVLVYFVIINIPSKQAVRNLVCEALRVLKPGGKLMLGLIPWEKNAKAVPGIKAAAKTMLAMLTRKRVVGYYGYGYAFFTDICEKFGCAEIVISHSTGLLIKQGTKFNVTITK